jgi:hypothetical protein
VIGWLFAGCFTVGAAGIAIDALVARRQRVCPVCRVREMTFLRVDHGDRRRADGTAIGWQARVYRCTCGEELMQLRADPPMTRSQFEDWIVRRGGPRRPMPPA